MKELFLLLWILFLCADKVNTVKQDIDPLAPYINYQMNNLCLECLANKGLCKEGVQMLLEKGYATEREVEIAFTLCEQNPNSNVRRLSDIYYYDCLNSYGNYLIINDINVQKDQQLNNELEFFNTLCSMQLVKLYSNGRSSWIEGICERKKANEKRCFLSQLSSSSQEYLSALCYQYEKLNN